MPLTWFAHQVPVLGMKLARPRWFEATALCVGSMTPDLMYAFSAYLRVDTHRFPAAFVVGIPFAVVLAVIVRRVLAPVGPAQLPDVGRLQLRSYAVLASRRPHVAVTTTCATLGIGSHIVLDWFTHPGRPGVRWLGYDDTAVTAFGVTEPLAGVLQLIGHSFGSLIGLALLALIGRRRLLEDWYGVDAVEASRVWRPSTRQRSVFWATSVAGLFAGGLWGAGGDQIEFIQRTFVGIMLGSIVGAVAVRRVGRVPTRSARQGPERATATPSAVR
ncbi:MAG: DUF4184 family protein [Ilumatobacter sp.]|uniref:DUF4184 family protein n=1 Tax=Ilumatobacter sp. TaxID=1967498 RepID=UPI003C7349FA